MTNHIDQAAQCECCLTIADIDVLTYDEHVSAHKAQGDERETVFAALKATAAARTAAAK